MKKRSSSQSSWALLASSVAQARVESHRIRHLVNRGQKLVENSVAKDHLYEVAGDLIMGVPDRLTHLERVLDRTSYALSLMGEEFFRGRLSLDDKEMVDQAVKFSQSPFPDVRRVASKYLEKRASLSDVQSRVENALGRGKINQSEYERMMNSLSKLSGRDANLLYGRASFPFRHKDKQLHTKVPQAGKPNGVKTKVPNTNFISKVTLEAHAYYRYELRDIGATALNDALNGWSNRINKGSLDIKSGIRSRQNTDNAEFYRSYKRNMGKGSDNFYHKASDTTLVISAAPTGSTARFDLFIVTMYKGQGSGGYRSRFAYRQPASELPGASTFVNEDSKKNLTPNTSKGVNDNADSREKSGPQTTENKQQVLPLKSEHSEKRDQKLPISQTDGKGTSRPQFNTPPDSENAEGGRPIHKEKVRTRSMPGDEYGVPYKDDGYGLSRRTMKATISRLADLYLSERNGE